MMKICMIFPLLLALTSHTEIIIKKLSYDAMHDELIIDVRYPGKCMEHSFNLEKVRIHDNEYRYHLIMTNPQDPCNGMVEETLHFPIGYITFRPAHVLISPEKDGSRAHSFTVPAHAKADILSASFINGSLEVGVLAHPQSTSQQFYVDPDTMCLSNKPCPAVIRNKRPSLEGEKLILKKIRLPLDELIKPITLSLETAKGPLSVYIPQ